MFTVHAADVDVDAPVEAVFRHYDDGRTYPEWMSRAVEGELLSAEPIAVGSRFRARFKGLGAVEWEVAEREPPRRLVHLGHAPVGTMRHHLAFEPVGSGTRISQRGEGELKPALRLLGPLLRPVLRRSMAKNWQATATELGRYLSDGGRGG